MTLDKIREELRPLLEREVAIAHYKFVLPEWVKGDKMAGEILGVSDSVMRMRRNSGYFIEGKDWKKANPNLKSGSILWNKDTLLREREKL